MIVRVRFDLNILSIVVAGANDRVDALKINSFRRLIYYY